MKAIVVIFLFFVFSVPVHAAEEYDSYARELLDAVGNETQSFLSSLGITDGNYDELLNIDFENVLQLLLKVCRQELHRPLGAFVCALAVLLLMSILQSVLSSGDAMAAFGKKIGLLILSFCFVVPVADCITDVLSVGDAINGLTKILIPSLAAIITVSGKPTLAICFQTLCMGGAQAISAYLAKLLPPIAAVYVSWTVCAALGPFAQIQKGVQLMKKGFVFVLSMCASIFSAVLSVKSIVSVGADTIAVKGIKFIVGNAVPIVGGALSDALSSVIAGVDLLKHSLGILAIIILMLFALPVLAALLLWSLGTKVLGILSGFLGQSDACDFFETFDGLFSILSVVTIYEAFLYIISIISVLAVAKM